jgi:acetoacetyl-CoA synthetase
LPAWRDNHGHIAQALRQHLSPRHVPDQILAVPGVLRTLTGKKLEVPVKRLLQGATVDGAASAGAVDRPELLAWYPDPANTSPHPRKRWRT